MEKGDRRYVLIILFLALVLRFAYALSVDIIPTDITGIDMDAVEYDHLGWNIARGIGVIDAYGHPASSRFPAYLYFLGIIYFIFGHSHFTVIMIQAFLGSLTPLIVYFTARQIFKERVSKIAGILAAVYPVFIWYVGWLMTENLFLLLLNLLIYFTVSLARDAGWKRLAAIGVLVGLLGLTRGVGLPFLGIIPFYVFLRLRGDIKIKFGRAALVLAAAIVVMIPWTVRNYNTYGKIMLPSCEGGAVLWMAFNTMSVDEWYDPEPAFEYIERVGRENATSEEYYHLLAQTNLFGLEGLRALIKDRYPYAPVPNSDLEGCNFLGDIAMGMLFENPVSWVVKSVIQVFRFWHVLDERGRFVNGYAFIMPFFLAGFWMSRKRIRDLMPLYIFPLELYAISIVFFADARFRMPFESIFLIVGAFAMERFIRIFKQPVYAYGIIAAFFLLTGYMRLYSVEIRAALRAVLGAIGVPLGEMT